jgi:hypothetical protein
MPFIKLHQNIVKLLKQEVKRKRNTKQAIYFARDLLKEYGKALYQEYRLLFLQFDSQYQKVKAEREKYQQYKKDINNAYKIIQWMIRQGGDRNQRKQIRRDFEKYGMLNKETEAMILRDIYGV